MRKTLLLNKIRSYKQFGYKYILKKDHPKATKMGYIREHRLIYEQYYKVCLLDWTDIHHINGDRSDNRIENLEALIHGDHSRVTFKKDFSNRICDICTVPFTKCWFKSPLGNFMCRNCYLLIYLRIPRRIYNCSRNMQIL